MGMLHFNAAGLLLSAGLAVSTLSGAAWAAPDADVTDTNFSEVDGLVLRQVEAMRLDALRRVEVGHAITLEALPLVEGLEVELDLTRLKIFSDDAVFYIDDVPQPLPDVASFRGTVSGDPDTYAFVSVSDFGVQGYVKLNDGSVFSISTGNLEQKAQAGEVFEPTDLRIVDSTFFQGAPLGIDACGTTITPEEIEATEPLSVRSRSGGDIQLGSSPCRVAEIAIDSDYEFSANRFGNNPTAAGTYATTLMSAVSEIYVREVNTRFEIPYIRMWSSNTDPYNDVDDPLTPVREYWTANMGSVNRDVVHMFTGNNPVYGGVAYLSVVCNNDWGYSVSAYINGSFPYPLQSNNNGNWDPVVVGHELGHCFSAPHTHDYNPPIDRCGIDCVGTTAGTIMSYCHGCSGGMRNIALEFHPTNRDRIQSFIDNASCLEYEDAGAGVAENDSANTFFAIPVTIDVLGNDAGDNCSATSIDSFDTSSANGGVIQMLAANNSLGVPGHESLRYTPPAGFTGTDTFTYAVPGGDIAIVTVEVAELMQPTAQTPDHAGLLVDYYLMTNNPDSVDDIEGLSPFTTSVATSINFPQTAGEFADSGVSDFIGAVYTGSFRAPFPSAYTFNLTSDDGSRMYIDDVLVIDNDGLHGSTTISSTVGLAQGFHKLRIEYFERGGDATLVATFSTTFSTGETTLGGTALGYAEEPVNCNGADIAEPYGTLNVDDVLGFLNAFAASDAAADLAAPTGTLNIDDVLAFLGEFASGCP